VVGCFSKLALLKSKSVYWSKAKQISSLHQKATCFNHDIAEK